MAITIYADQNYKGKSDVLKTGNYPTLNAHTSPKFPNVDTVPSIGIDRLSSVKIEPGTYAEFHITQGFRDGSFMLFAGDYANLASANDKIDAIKVFDHDADIFPLIEFYNGANFEGYRQTLAGTGQVTTMNSPFIMQDIFSSVKVPEGVKVTLYEHPNLGGRSLTLEAGEYPHLGIFGFDNIVSSIQIIQNNLELIDIEYLAKEDIKQGETVFIESIAQNNSNLEQSASLSLETAYEETFTRSFSNSTLFGLEVSRTVEVGADTGVLSASVSTTITANFEKTFTVGREESTSKTVAVSKSLNVNIPPNTIAKASMSLTPQELKVRAKYTFRLIGTQRTTTQEVLIEIQNASVGACVIEEFVPAATPVGV